MTVTRESIIAALEAVSAHGIGVTEACDGAIMAYGARVYWDDQDSANEGWWAKLYDVDHETGIYQDGSEDGVCIDDAEDLAYVAAHVAAHVAAQTAEMLAAADEEEDEAEFDPANVEPDIPEHLWISCDEPNTSEWYGESWIVPPVCQGQTVEVAYAGVHDGLVYRRCYDRSDRTTSYCQAEWDGQ